MPRTIIPVSLDVQADGDILDWLEVIPEGRRSATIREAIRAYIGQESVTLADVYRAVMELKRLRPASADAEEIKTETGEDPEISDNLDRLLGL